MEGRKEGVFRGCALTLKYILDCLDLQSDCILRAVATIASVKPFSWKNFLS